MNFKWRKRLAVSRRKAALQEMDVDLSRKAKKCIEVKNNTASSPEAAKPPEKQAPKPVPEARPEQPDTNEQLPKPPLNTLGVSVYHLKHLFVELAQLPKHYTIHDIEDLEGPPGVIRLNSGDTVCPVDGQMGAAYVHCLEGEDHVGEATHMLSYSWKCTIGDIVSTLYDYCETHDLSTNRTYIWMDCLCLNQHRVVENREKGIAVPTQEFKATFQTQIQNVGHVLAMMEPIEAPMYLTRLWCLFEMYQAHANGCKVDIIMPPKEKRALQQDVMEEQGAIDGLYKSLGSTKIQNTAATVESDKQTILQILQDDVGYDAVNNQLVRMLREWMKNNLTEIVDQQENTKDLNYASLCSTIGLMLWDNQECDEALALLQKSASIQESLYGEDHPDTAITYNNIGLVLKDKGDYEGALKLFRKCLAIDEASYGKDDPGTADSYSNIACVILDKGDYDEALEEYQKCLAIQESSLGKDHYDTATTYKSVGTVLEAKGDHDGAMEMYQKCLAIQSATLGNDHPTTQSCLEAIESLKSLMKSSS